MPTDGPTSTDGRRAAGAARRMIAQLPVIGLRVVSQMSRFPPRFDPKYSAVSSHESDGRSSFAALLTVPHGRSTGDDHVFELGSRVAVQMSYPPQPPGRFDSK